MKTYAGGVALVEVVRSGFVEGFHHGSVVILDASGHVLESTGDRTGAIFPRSANKPLQAIGMQNAGLNVHGSDLALVASSHWGEDFHLAAVRQLLASAGLSEADLRGPAVHRLSWPCGDKEQIYIDCSGKHAGMLLTCIANGWPTESYLDATHPLQRKLFDAVGEHAGESIAATGIDGCGAPVFAISLTGLATAFLRMSTSEVADAMRAYPEYVSGTARQDALLMRAVPGLVSKVGAEGVWAAAIPNVGAVALKIDDGAARARVPVMLSALRRLAVEAKVPAEEIQGGGKPVGTYRPTW